MMLYVPIRTVIKIAVTTSGNTSLKAVAAKYDMKEYAVGGKIYDWFLAQDDIFQRAVLGLIDGIEVDAAKAFMERISKRGSVRAVDAKIIREKKASSHVPAGAPTANVLPDRNPVKPPVR